MEIKTEKSFRKIMKVCFKSNTHTNPGIFIGNTDLTKYRFKKYLIDKLFELSVSGTQMISIFLKLMELLELLNLKIIENVK